MHQLPTWPNPGPEFDLVGLIQSALRAHAAGTPGAPALIGRVLAEEEIVTEAAGETAAAKLIDAVANPENIEQITDALLDVAGPLPD